MRSRLLARCGAATVFALATAWAHAAPPAVETGAQPRPWSVPGTVGPASARKELHGAADAFAADGVALAWGVLRAPNDDDTAVVVRVDADPRRFATIEIVGTDPFGGREATLLARTELGGPFDLKVARRQFADYPRTEIRLAAKGEAAPSLVVYFLGVPDTTPETTRADDLDRSLATRLARAVAESKRRRP